MAALSSRLVNMQTQHSVQSACHVRKYASVDLMIEQGYAQRPIVSAEDGHSRCLYALGDTSLGKGTPWKASGLPCQAEMLLYLTVTLPEQGETVPYIICVELDDQGQQKESTGGLADRAYHRDELAANSNLRVDVEYYLANQVTHLTAVFYNAAKEASSEAGSTQTQHAL